jgi:putative ABC transport system substrate-binding protein
VKRREFITLLGGAAAWPLAARAQQTGRMRRVGVLMTLAADDPEAQARIGAFLQGMQEFGWTIGRNLRIDYRWASDLNSVPAAKSCTPRRQRHGQQQRRARS